MLFHSLDVRHDNAFVIGADNRVGLPVSDAAFCGDNRRPLIDIDAVRNQPARRPFHTMVKAKMTMAKKGAISNVEKMLPTHCQ